jgi:hypothetical protein
MMLRIGAVSYLNTRPLIFGLHERLTGRRIAVAEPAQSIGR